MTYETPAITELGTVADFTRADEWGGIYDGQIFHKNVGGGGGGTPTS